jgi:hypothetical protein
MEKKYGDGGGREEEEGREQLTVQQNQCYFRRPLSTCTSHDYQVGFVIYSFFSSSIFSLNKGQ